MIGNRDKKVLKRFGQRVKAARKARKLSIRKLALEADIDLSTLFRIEKGESNPALTTILALAAALGVDPGELLKS